MNSFLKTEFKRGFLVSTENIIKLNDLISKRLDEKEFPQELKFKIIRSDALAYITADHKVIVEEENSKRNLIKLFTLSYKNDDLDFELTFDKAEHTTLKIESTDKDFTYLLFSDIKDYLNTEVLIFRSFKFSTLSVASTLAPLVGLIILIFSYFLSDRPNLTDQQFSELMNSSLDEKLNYVLKVERSTTNFGPIWKALLVTIIAFIIIASIGDLMDRLYPRNIFYLGKEVGRYDTLVSRRNKWLWGVLIALIISTVSGLLVFFITSRH